MENTDKNDFKNMAEKLKLLPESNIKIQSDDEFDFKIFRCLREGHFTVFQKIKWCRAKNIGSVA